MPRDSVTDRTRALGRVIVIGTLAPTATATLGVARTVIDRADLAAEPSHAAVDPLRTAPGVHIDEANGRLGPTIIRIRGGEEQFTQVLVDGVSVNENGGFFDWHGLGLVNVGSVQIARGPQSAVYGTSAMSGAVQLLTRAGQAGPVQTDVTLEGAQTSSHGGGWRGIVESQGGTDRLRFSAGAGAASERGVYALPNNLHDRDLSLRIDYAPRAKFAVTSTVRWMSAGSLLPVRNPGITRAPLDPNQEQSRDRLVGSVEATWAPSDRSTHRLSLTDYHLVFHYDDTKDAVDAARYTVFFPNYSYHYRATLDRASLRYVGTVTGRPSPTTATALSYGASWEDERLQNVASGDFGPSTQDISRASYGAFAEGQLRAGDRWSFVAGARAQRFQGVGSTLVPRATVVLALVPHAVSLRAAAASAYAAPNIQVQYSDPGFFVGNPDLKSETSRSVEAGIDLTGARASASATLFSQTYDNLIRVVPVAAGKAMNKNIGRVRASGVEVEGVVRVTPAWRIGANGAWTSTEVVDNSGLDTGVFPNGQPLPFRPTYNATLYTSFPMRTATIMARLSSVGPQTVLTERFRGQRAGIASTRRMNVTVTQPLTRSLEGYVHAENATNGRYLVAWDRPAPPRSLAVGVRAHLGGGAQ